MSKYDIWYPTHPKGYVMGPMGRERVLSFVHRLSDEDRAEISALGERLDGESLLEHLRKGHNWLMCAWDDKDDVDGLQAMGGIWTDQHVPIDDPDAPRYIETATVWLLVSNDFKAPPDLIKIARKFLRTIMVYEEIAEVRNVISVESRRALTLVKRLGFRVSETSRDGILGISLRREDV